MALNNEFSVTLGLKKEGFSKGLQDAGDEVDDLGKKLGELEKESGAVTKGLDSTGKAAEVATKGTKNLGDSAGNLGASLVGVGTAIIAVVGFVAEYVNRLTDAEEAVKNLRTATAGFTATAQTQIKAYQNLIDIASDETQSLEDRETALFQVNQESGKLIGNLTLEELGAGTASDAINAYSESLLRNAKIQGIRAALTETFKKIALEEGKSIKELTETWEQWVSVVANASGIGLITDTVIDNNAVKRGAETIKNLTANAEALSEQLSILQQQQTIDPTGKPKSDEAKSKKEAEEKAIRDVQRQLAATKKALAEAKRANAEALKLKIGIAIDDINTNSSDIKLAIEDLNKQYSEAISFDQKNEIIKKQYALELDLLAEQYKKAIVLAGDNEQLKIQALNNTNAAVIKETIKLNKDLETLKTQENSKAISGIKDTAKLELAAQIAAINQKYAQLGVLTREQEQKRRDEISAIKTQNNNKAIQDEINYWDSLINNDIVKGEKRIEVEKIIQAKLAELREEGYTAHLDGLSQFSKDVYSLVEGELSSAFAGIGRALGEGMNASGNILTNLGNAVIKAFASFLGSMGQLLINYGTLAIIKGKLDTVIATGGAQAIAAGIASIAIGVALMAASSAFGSVNVGGDAGSSSYGGSSYSSSGASSSAGGGISSSSYGGGSNGDSNGGRVVFEIAGDKLIGVLNNTTNGNFRTGDNAGLITG